MNTVPTGPQPRTAPAGDVVKRLFIGRALASNRLGDTLLPKRIALPVFCSDPISSVAYATEQIILVLGTAGAVKVVVQTDDGAQDLGSMPIDCPLCMLAGAPPPLPVASTIAPPLPLGRALQSIPAARIAAATAAPPPARAPPTFS